MRLLGRFALTLAGKINDRLHTQLGNAADSHFVRAAFETVIASGNGSNDTQG